MRTLLLIVVGILLGVGGTVAARQGAPTGVRAMKLPLDLPAVGNIEGVRKWRFGRIESVSWIGAEEVAVDIRLASDQTVRVTGPRAPLGELGRRCDWLQNPTQTTASRRDYVERMIAFDADEQGRIIAVMSMEPIGRSVSRLRQAFCSR